MLTDQKPETPYFVIHREELDRNFEKLKNAISARWPNYRIGYSYKTNALPWIITHFDRLGCCSEVVSADEYNLGKLLGIEKDRFIYNGPVKTKETFTEALRNGCIVNIDSQREIGWLDGLPEGPEYQIGIRVNFDVEKYCPGETQCGTEGGRFGFCYENGELLKAIEAVRDKGFLISGLHLHVSSRTRSVEIYEAIAEVACEIAERYGQELTFLDIGGGFFGGLPEKPQFEEYFQRITKILRRHYSPEKTRLIIEPGMAVIGSWISYVSSVIDIKTTVSNRFVITDGSRTSIDPLMTKNRYFYEDRLKDSKRGRLDKQVICGYTCMEHDRLFTAEDALEYRVGDRIVYNRVGAYTMCLSPLFIKYFPPVYVCGSGKLEPVRDAWKPEQYVQQSLPYRGDTGEKTNILILAAGTRNKIVQYFRRALKGTGTVIAADSSRLGPAIYEADRYYIVPPITENGYIEKIFDICRKEKIKGVFSLIDPELGILAGKEREFREIGVTVIGSSRELCEMSLDKYRMGQWLEKHGYRCARSWVDKEEFYKELAGGTAAFPVFVKPVRGSASISISRANDRETVDMLFAHEEGLMIQEYLDGQEIGADVYIDMLSGETVSIFTKKKIKMRAGETDKAVSFKDDKLFRLIEDFVRNAGYKGQIDIDLFDIGGEYYISEVNPRFGGGYPHAYEAGCNHMKLILENLRGNANMKNIGNYEEGIYMMKYNEIKTYRGGV